MLWPTIAEFGYIITNSFFIFPTEKKMQIKAKADISLSKYPLIVVARSSRFTQTTIPTD